VFVYVTKRIFTYDQTTMWKFCLICLMMMVSLKRSSGEECQQGYVGDPCRPCPENHFASAGECVPCPYKTKSDEGSSICDLCLLGDIWLRTVTNCEDLWGSFRLSTPPPDETNIDSRTSSSSSRKSNGRAIASIAVSTLFVLSLAIFGIAFRCRRKREGLPSDDDGGAYDIIVHDEGEAGNPNDANEEVFVIGVDETAT